MSGRVKDENALAGVDYFLMKAFKDAMCKVSERTRHLCANYGVRVLPTVNGLGGIFRIGDLIFVKTKEGLGNKAWIAMLLTTSVCPTLQVNTTSAAWASICS